MSPVLSGSRGGNGDHTHANKAILDGITAPNLAPSGGLVGQTLTAGASGRVWQDVPGIVYPTLLLSPDGSFDRNGPMSPTVGSSVTVVAGQYGNAWNIPGTTGATNGVTFNSAYVPVGGRGSIMIRLTPVDDGVDSAYVLYVYAGSGVRYEIRMTVSTGTLTATISGATTSNTVSGIPEITDGVPVVIGISATPKTNTLFVAGRVVGVFAVPPFTATPISVQVGWGGTGQKGMYESIVMYSKTIPDAEIKRISTMPEAWTMANAAANILIPNTFIPTNRTASGTTNLRTAPGAATTLITALVAGSLVQDTGGRVTETGTVYARVIGPNNVGTGWIPASQLTAL